MEILRVYGVPEKTVSAIAATYAQTWAEIRPLMAKLILAKFLAEYSKATYWRSSFSLLLLIMRSDAPYRTEKRNSVSL